MRKSIFLIGAVGLISSTALNSQVTIGADAPPSQGALLELKESVVPDATNSTAKKGMLFPRVALESRNDLFPMFDEVAGNNYMKDGNPFPKSEEDISHTGLVVYNTNKTTFVEGLYVWDGKEWKHLNESTSIEAAIESLICGSKSIGLNRLANNVPYDQILKIPYEGGNGGAYPATPAESIGYGLTIARLAGTLAMGQGEVAYRISGTPTSLPTNNIVSFPLTFLDETCTVTIGEDTEIKTMKFVRKSIPLIGSTLPTASEITFGNVTFRFAYRAAGTGVTEACRPEFKPVFNTRMLYWFRKAGSGGGMYTRYGQINASSDNWYTYADGDHTSAFAPTSQTANEYISAENRDFAEAIIMLQNDDFREMYRVTYNVYNGTNTVPVTTAACTIFIEKLD